MVMESGLFSFFGLESLETNDRFSFFGLETLETNNNFSLFGMETLESLPVSGINNIPLFIRGNYGEPYYSGMPLYIYGTGNPIHSSIPLYTEGCLSVNSGMPLYTFGVQPVATGRSLYTAGSLASNSGMTLYLNGLLSSGMPLFIHGLDTKTSGIPLYMAGHIYDSGMMPLYIAGHIQSNLGTNLYIGDFGERMDSTIPLFTEGQGTFSGMELVVWGGSYTVSNPDITLNGVPDYGMINLFIYSDGTHNNIPLYINSPTGTNTNIMDLYITASQPVPSSMPLFIDSYDYETGPMKMYCHGF